MSFRLPTDGNRCTILGMTGSGKTIAGLWQLSRRSYETKPWIILDFKRDSTIAQIPRLEEIGLTDRVPTKPGLYVIRPMLGDNTDDEVENFLRNVWWAEHTGLYFDEGYMIRQHSHALKAILTQGRSKRIPVISLSQRPVELSRFLLSESEFLQMFFLHTPADIKRMRDWMPWDGSTPERFHSYWYDVARRQLTYLKPVPDESEILNRFDDRIPRRRRWI